VINHTRIAQVYVINTHPRARFDRGFDDFAILVHNVARPGENIIARTIRVVRANNERFERLIISRRAFLSRCFEERPRYRYCFCETPERTPKHKKSRLTRASGKILSLALPTKANSNSLCQPASVDTNCESYDLIDLSSSSIASASFLTPRWSSPIISTPRGDKASSRSKTSSPSNRGPNGSRSRCVMR